MAENTVPANAGIVRFEDQHEVVILMKEEVNFDFKGDFLARAKDVANGLGYSGTDRFTNHVKDKYLILVRNTDISVPPKRRIRKLNNAGELFVTSHGLYQGLTNSKMPKAEPFQDWLFEEVIPSIQKHGMYAIDELLDNPDFMIQALQELKKEREVRKQLEEQAQTDKPKVIFADAVSASKTSIVVGELAKILKQNGIETGGNRLFDWMHSKGYLIKRKGTDYNMPTQRAMEMGLFEIKETSIAHSDGHTTISKTSKVTGVGQVYFINKFKKAN